MPDQTATDIQLLPEEALQRSQKELADIKFALDESAIVRTLIFQESDWSAFQPERYNQPLLRSWHIALSDQLNTLVEERIPLALDPERSLPVGAYYLRLRSLEGPRADLLLLVGRTRLTLQTNEVDALIWATDVISGSTLERTLRGITPVSNSSVKS